MKTISILTTLSLVLLFAMSIVLTAQAAGQPQQLITPTAGPDGRIIWVVQEGQTCTQIANLAKITLVQLRALNNLTEECPLTTGQRLVIGTGGPGGGSAPTSGPVLTPTPPPPTPTQ